MTALFLYALIGFAVALLSGLAKGSMRRLWVGGAIGLLIAYVAFPFSRSLGNLSRETVDPTLLGLLPTFPLLFLIPVFLGVALLLGHRGGRAGAWAAVSAGVGTLLVALGFYAQPVHLVRLLPVNGLMELLTALVVAGAIGLAAWGRPRLRPLLGVALLVGGLVFVWLNSSAGHTYLPNSAGYYKLLTPAPPGADKALVDVYNAGLEARNAVAKENGLPLAQPITALTDLKGGIPAEAAAQGYRMLLPTNRQYGAFAVFVLAGLMLGAGLLHLRDPGLQEVGDLRAGIVLASVFSLLLPAFDATEFNLAKLVKGWPFLVQFGQKSWPPLLADPGTNRFPLQEVLSFMAITVEIALVGTFLAALFALPTSFLAARNLTGGSPIMRGVFYFMRGFYNVDRGIDTLILALILVAAVGLGPFAGVLAMAIHSVADLGKLYSEAIENVDKGPIEALESTGAAGVNVLRWAILPQVLPLLVSYTVYRFEINFRVSIILGFVGAGGIGFFIQGAMAAGQYNQMIIGVIAIVIVVNLIDFASSWLRSRLV
jgi:phosphonate ABC transporter permease subunit PhnE